MPNILMEAGSMIDLTGVNLGDVLKEVTALVPKVLPVVIGFIAFRKGYGFIKSSLKGA